MTSTHSAVAVPDARLPRRSAAWRDAVTRLTGYVPEDREQEEWRDAYLHALEDDRAVFKAGPPVHLTASCIVLDAPGERVLLAMHRKARKWLQFGGHIELDDVSLHATAVREVREESGVEGIVVDPRIVELHRHALNARFGRCQEHLDVRFVGIAPPDAEPVCSEESLEVRWFALDALPSEVSEELGALISRGLRAR